MNTSQWGVHEIGRAWGDVAMVGESPQTKEGSLHTGQPGAADPIAQEFARLVEVAPRAWSKNLQQIP